MIRPPGWDGVAFTDRSQGDVRADDSARRNASLALGIDHRWAVARQVHGIDVARVSSPGDAGEHDGLWTSEPGLPVAVFTADCFGVVLLSSRAVGVAHAGWRGAAGGVVEGLRKSMTEAGHTPDRAAVGPGIGPCCFEVGAEVADRFDYRYVGETTWSSTSVDLPSSIEGGLQDLDVWVSGKCTFHEDGWFSHREDGTGSRMAAIAWVT